VLDNYEHLLDGVVVLLERPLAGSSRLTVLATSRARLLVPFEWVSRCPGCVSKRTGVWVRRSSCSSGGQRAVVVRVSIDLHLPDEAAPLDALQRKGAAARLDGMLDGISGAESRPHHPPSTELAAWPLSDASADDHDRTQDPLAPAVDWGGTGGQPLDDLRQRGSAPLAGVSGLR
jgi:hypothetical protein